MYNIIADLHTHSIASTHAYSTIKEMAVSAREKNLKAIAITDHAKTMPGSPGLWYFSNMQLSLPRDYQGVKLLVGIEANVIDFNGTIDVNSSDIPYLDWVVASIHDIGIKELEDSTVEKCTNLWMGVANNPLVNVIGHSGDPKWEYDYEKMIPIFGEKGKLVEINSHSFDVRPQNEANCLKIAKLCKKHGVQIIVNSDAHSEYQIGDFSAALNLLKSIDFPEELIVNSSEERLYSYFRKYSKIFER